MVIPATGPISMSQINTELRLTSNTRITLNQANVRALLGRPTNLSRISLSDARGKSSVVPGSILFTNTAVPTLTVTGNFTIPQYNRITIEVRGGGGGGQSGSYYGPSFFGPAPFPGRPGISGVVSSMFGLAGGGGGGGQEQTPGAIGTASGPAGSTLLPGSGKPGGAGGAPARGIGGTSPQGDNGGNSGYAGRSWNRGDVGAPVPGTAYTYIAGRAGSGGDGTSTIAGFPNATSGGAGTRGDVLITWS